MYSIYWKYVHKHTYPDVCVYVLCVSESYNLDSSRGP